MGRPLSQKLLEKMGIKVSVNGAEKTLAKQVGFNKYKTEDGAIVTLGKDASLLIVNGEKSAEVIKIARNVLYTDGGFVAAYDVKEGGIKLLDESLDLSTEVKDEDEVETEDNEPSADAPTVDDNDDEPESEGSGEGMGEE